MKHYCPYCGREMQEKQLICPKCRTCCELFENEVYVDKSGEILNNLKEYIDTIGGNVVLDAHLIDANMQWRRYTCGPNGSTGHGFAAEDANGFWDRWKYGDVLFSGRDNAKNGPDRIVNGVNIQTKYCKTPSDTINAAFDNNGKGEYKYYDRSGKPMLLEAPSDQYPEVIEKMREKIQNGQVQGITDPDMAESLVRKGQYTYKQSQNIAKAGTIDSLKFDIQTGAVIGLSSFGISFVINWGMAMIYRKKNGMTQMDCLESAFLVGVKTGGKAWLADITSKQLFRTAIGRNIAAKAEKNARIVINKIYNSGKKGERFVFRMSGASGSEIVINERIPDKRSELVKKIGTKTVVMVVFFVINETPELIRLCKGYMSFSQFLKNLSVVVSGMIGAEVGAILGSLFGGLPGEIIGGFIGGGLFSKLSKYLGDKISEDDARRMMKLVLCAKIRLTNDYLLQTNEEVEYCDRQINRFNVINERFLLEMYAAGKEKNDDESRVQYAYNRMEYYYWLTIRRRGKVDKRISKWKARMAIRKISRL